MLKLKLNHTPRDVKVLTDQLVDRIGSGGVSVTPFIATFQTSTNASEAQTNLGISVFAKSLLDDTSGSAALTTLGLSEFGKSLVADVDASAALTSLGVSAFAKTVLDDTSASAVLDTLGVSSFAKNILDDADASGVLTTLGVSSFAKTLLDDTDAASARATLGAMSQDAYDNRKQYVPKNLNYNGDFEWYRIADSITYSGIGPAERWQSKHTGSTKTATIEFFDFGQTDVPGDPETYLRTVVSSVAGATNCAYIQYPFRNVETLAEKRTTITFWAKADATRSISAELIQNFSTSPGASPVNVGIGSTKFSLSTSWQKCQIVVDIPSVAGKSVGDYTFFSTLDFRIWFDAGSSFNARTVSLGHQSGTFDIAHVSIVEGDASDVADPFWGHDDSELINELNRYYYFIPQYFVSGYAAASGSVFTNITHPEHMIVTPTVYFYSTTYTNSSAVSNALSNRYYSRLRITATALGAASCQTGIEFYSNLNGSGD